MDQGTSDEALRLMAQKQASDLLAELLPWNVRVPHKWGEIPGARHEAGIVYGSRFEYVVVVMTENVDPRGSPAYIRDLSKAVYDYFDQEIPAPPPTSAPVVVPADGTEHPAARHVDDGAPASQAPMLQVRVADGCLHDRHHF